MCKKIISVILVLCVFMSFTGSLTASAASSVPIVYIGGQGAELYTKDGKCAYAHGRVLTDVNIGDAAKELVPLFAGAAVFGNWEKYKNAAMDILTPIYRNVALDKNGEPSNGTYVNWSWSPETLRPDYNMHAYFFWHDWRTDPFENAEELNRFIEAVKEKTGAKKVNLAGRCEGCTLILTYLAQYGYDNINCIALYVSSVKNINAIGALFSGDIDLNPSVLEKYYYNAVNIDDYGLSVFLDKAVKYLVDSYGFEDACKLCQKAMPKLYSKAANDFILATYGTFPGMWANIGPEYYAKARKNVFTGKETEYAGLIEKLDHYDTAVRQRTDELLLEAKERGINVGVFAKYGDFSFSIPVCKEGIYPNDNMCNLTDESFGATCSQIDSVLSDEYLANADMSYISADRRVDASTCLFPETTWFNYNSQHKDFNDETHDLIEWFFENNSEVTVFSDPAYPQYYVTENGSIRAMTADDVTAEYEKDNTPRFFRVIKKFTSFIKAIFSYLFDLIRR